MICSRHWLPVCLPNWAEFIFAGRPAALRDENVLCDHHDSNAIFPTFPLLQVEWYENCAKSLCILCQLEYVRWSIANAPRTNWSRLVNVFLSRRSAANENWIEICGVNLTLCSHSKESWIFTIILLFNWWGKNSVWNLQYRHWTRLLRGRYKVWICFLQSWIRFTKRIVD